MRERERQSARSQRERLFFVLSPSHLLVRMARSFFLPLTLAVLLAGCLPSSNQRKLERALFPSDSLSRAIAEAAPVDTMQFVRHVTAPPEANLEYPTSLALRPDGGIVVAETQRGALVYFDSEGGYERTVEDRVFSYPFIAGVVGDTVAVLNRGTHRVDLVVSERVVASIDVPEARNGSALFTEWGLFYKTSTEDGGARLYQIGLDGDVEATYDLAGPYWRHLGFLRTWGDSLLALSGYRPVVDVLDPDLPPAGGAALDTLALMGFDSPQFPRSRQFAAGDADEPPLLSPSAAAVGDRLFVLNARPGWVRIDVFRRDDGPEGPRLLLERGLVEPNPGLQKQYFAADLAARRIDGGYEFIVLTTDPQPGLTLLRWTPDEPLAAVATR
jgi:hypothetical protein